MVKDEESYEVKEYSAEDQELLEYLAAKEAEEEERKGLRDQKLKNISIFLIFFVMIGVWYLSNRHEKKREDARKAHYAAQYVAQDKVSNSGWDGSVWQAEAAIKSRLKDPKSFEAISWGKVVKVTNQPWTYVVRCSFRAKNSFGGYDTAIWVVKLNAEGKFVAVDRIVN